MRGKIIVLFLLLMAVLTGCQQSVSEIGSGLFTNTLFSIVYVDSVSLKVSTVLTYDSVITSTATRLLVGYHQDAKLGTVSSKSIFQLGTNGAPIQLDRHSTEYVGLTLYLKRDGYSYYDTTQTQTISVYQLSKELGLYKNIGYNTSTFKANSTPLGSLTFLPRPHRTDSVEISLPDELGQQLMTMAQTNDVRLSTSPEFVKFFRGLALIPDSSSSNCMVGFKTTPEMRLYYRDLTSPSIYNKHISFTVGTANPYFNQVYTNRAGTLLSSLKRQNDILSSTLTDNQAYIQSTLGLAIRIEMPYVRNFLYNDRNFTCSRAVLEMMPIQDFTTHSPLPPLLYLYRVDNLNRVLTSAPQGGNLIKDVESGVNTRYSSDITNFVNSQIQTDATNNNALLILVDDKQFRSSVNRLYIGDKRNQFAMKIKLYYISLSN